MSVLRLRGVELARAGLNGLSVLSQAEVVSLLQEVSLTSDEADHLEAGLYWILVHVETLLQHFLEAGGLEPLLERTIRPGAMQLLDQAVGSCPPWIPPPISGVLIPRVVLLKAFLVQVGRSGVCIDPA